MREETPGWVHRYAVALVACIVFLIGAGALVKSKEAGLSVPDWPLSYGSLNPPRWWTIENVRAEHGHRLIAGTVALLAVGLAIAMSRVEPRRWLRKLSYAAVVAVLLQALLGGLTVLFFLPTPISVSHAGLAQLFLCLIVTIAVATSRWWRDQPSPQRAAPSVFTAAAVTTGAVYVQILVGAVMRHSGAGLAIPDFPLAFGRLIPPRFDFSIAIHFSHRLGALVVCGLVAWTVLRVFRGPRSVGHLRRPAQALIGLVAVQITLGATVVLSKKAVLPNTVHVAVGAMVLATSLMLTLRAWRLSPRRVAVTAPRAEAAT
ncbi:MAG: heme A synthase [bacterium]|nr:heme A synthase [bacterium]